MAARAALYSLLETDPYLSSLFPRVYAQNSVDTPPEQRFIVIRWEQGDRVFGNHLSERVSIWFHDKDFHYEAIQQGVDRLREISSEVIHREGADGNVLTCLDWISVGPDLADDGFHTRTKWVNLLVVSRTA